MGSLAFTWLAAAICVVGAGATGIFQQRILALCNGVPAVGSMALLAVFPVLYIVDIRWHRWVISTTPHWICVLAIVGSLPLLLSPFWDDLQVPWLECGAYAVAGWLEATAAMWCPTTWVVPIATLVATGGSLAVQGSGWFAATATCTSLGILRWGATPSHAVCIHGCLAVVHQVGCLLPHSHEVYSPTYAACIIILPMAGYFVLDGTLGPSALRKPDVPGPPTTPVVKEEPGHWWLQWRYPGLIAVLFTLLAGCTTLLAATRSPQIPTDMAEYVLHAFRPYSLSVDLLPRPYGHTNTPPVHVPDVDIHNNNHPAPPPITIHMWSHPEEPGYIVPHCPVPCEVLPGRPINQATREASIIVIAAYRFPEIPPPRLSTKARGQRWVLSFGGGTPSSGNPLWSAPKLWRGIDWTSSMSLTSDFPDPVCFLRSGYKAPAYPKSWDVPLVAAVSNCGNDVNPFSMFRVRYLEALTKHVTTHSIGRCVHTFDAPGQDKWVGNPRFWRRYPFVFAFESRAEVDYVSEKVFAALAAYAIPVYYGAPNVRDHLPMSSFIDARDFPRAEDLALYLKRVASNRTLWASYHAWRNTPLDSIRSLPFCDRRVECRMCMQHVRDVV